MDWLSHLADAPFANILFLAGLAFLAVGVLGKIAGKIEPDKVGRAAAAVVGVALICVGLYLHVSGDQQKDQNKQANNSNSASPTPTPDTRQGQNVTVGPVKTTARRTPDNNVSRRPVDRNEIAERRNPPDEQVKFPPERSTPDNNGGRGPVDQPVNGGNYQSGPVPPPPPKFPPRSPDMCKQGYVWREAFPNDHVCVIPAMRQLMARENSEAAIHRNPAGGPYGPDTCLDGYVWREAQPADHVCVIPEARRRVAIDNAQAPFRRE